MVIFFFIRQRQYERLKDRGTVTTDLPDGFDVVSTVVVTTGISSSHVVTHAVLCRSRLLGTLETVVSLKTEWT